MKIQLPFNMNIYNSLLISFNFASKLIPDTIYEETFILNISICTVLQYVFKYNAGFYLSGVV